MKKVIAVILLVTTFNLYGESSTPEPYGEDEFPTVLEDVRRASVVFCGAFPLGYIYSSLVWDQVFNETDYDENLDLDDNEEIETKLVSALIFSGFVMIIDLIIEKFFRGS